MIGDLPAADRSTRSGGRWCLFINPIAARPSERDPVAHLVATHYAIGSTATATTRCG